nr:hypothetical protein [Bradyrhizobium canariense]
MPYGRAIQNERRKNLFWLVLQSECAALHIVAASGRALLGDQKTVLSRNRFIGSHDGLKPQEILFRLSPNHTFYSGGRQYRHGSLCVRRSVRMITALGNRLMK